MIAIELTITQDEVSPALRELSDGLDDDRLLPVLARTVNNSMRGHFDELEDTRPNKMGGSRRHYYSGARAKTTFTVSGNTAFIFTTQVGMRMRYFGGTIRAGAGISSATGKPTKYLTIPETAESYGHRAADFDDLEVLWGRDGPYGLGRVERKTIQRGDSFTQSNAIQTEVLFWLVPEVEIPEDHTMLPESGELNDALHEDFGKHVNRLWYQAGYRMGAPVEN